MRIHYSSQVRVRVTDAGRKTYTERLGPLPEDGVVEMSLWAAMRCFGPALYHGQDQPLDPWIEIISLYDPAQDQDQNRSDRK